jgi:hypothetical protein
MAVEQEEAANVKGKWFPSDVFAMDLAHLVQEGFLPSQEVCSWRSAISDKVPSPRVGEIVVLKSHIERGISFSPSSFFSEVLAHYGLQPFHIPPNSIITLGGIVALYEGYLGIRPRLDLFSFYYQIKRQTVYAEGPLACCGSVSFKIRRNRNYSEVSRHELVKKWTASYFLCKDIPMPCRETSWPASIDGPPEPVPSWT